MSTIICLKEGDTLVLGTDSRFMKHDYSGIASDEEQKIFEVAPETFLATSGRKMVCDFQVARARKIADELGAPPDIQVIGEALKCEWLSCLMELLELLKSQPDEETRQVVTGQSLLHGSILVGRAASGKLGFIAHSYRVQAGKVECEWKAYFGGRRNLSFSVGTPSHLLGSALQFTQDPTIWTNPPVKVVRRILAELKRSSQMIGGPDQIVCLDRTGAHWISQPPVARGAELDARTAATITAMVSLTAPTIVVSGSGWQINLDTANGFKVTNTGNGDFLQMLNTALILQNPGGSASSQFDLRHLSGSDYGEMVLSGGGGATGTLKVRPLSGTAVGAAGGASALPASPAGYLTWDWNGATIRIPYYN